MTEGTGTAVPHGELFVAFAEAVIADDTAALARAGKAIAEAMGDAALVDSAAVAGLFNAIDRVADSTGTPLEDWKAEQTADFRAALGLDAFAAAKID